MLAPRTPGSGVHVCVAGLGLSGAAAERVLAQRGAQVTTVDAKLGNDEVLPPDAELVVTSPGWRPTHPLFAQAAARGVPVWGEVELAWRLRDPSVPWLGVTGTNGKTTTVRMLTSMLSAAGHRAVACGNVGVPLLDAVLAEPAYDVLAVELSSYQLHWTSTVACRAAAILNLAPDHLDWHGSVEDYAADKARIWAPGTVAVFNADDDATRRLAASRHDSGPAPVSFTLTEPAPGQLGVLAGALVERGPDGSVVELAPVDVVQPPAPHNVANALAAAALARTLEVGRGRRGRRDCAPSVPTRTASTWSPRSTASTTSTTRRPPTRMPRPRRWRRSDPWCGSPVASRRARSSTSWWRAPPTGCAGSCCSAGTGR